MKESGSIGLNSAQTMRPVPRVARPTRRLGAGVRLLLALGVVVTALGFVGALLAVPRDVEALVPLLAVIAIGIPFAWLVWTQPVIALVVILFLNASFFKSSVLDVRVGFGGFDLNDLLLLGLLGMLAFRKLVNKTLDIPWWAVSAPLLLFLSMAAFSLIYALVLQHVEPTLVFNELRPIIYYLAAFAVAWSITRPRQLVVLLGALFVIADLVALIIIVQQFKGLHSPLIESVMSGSGRTWLLWEVAGISSGFGSVRVVPAGHVLTYAMSIVAFTSLFRARQPLLLRGFFAAQFLFINIGLLLTYTRAQWIASAVAVTLTLIVLMVVNRHRVITFFLVSVLVLLLVLSLVGVASDGFDQGTTSSPLMQRLLTIFKPDETLDTASLQQRFIENDEAITTITKNPLLGVGLGNDYRGAILSRPRESVGDLRFARFIHNAYLYIAAKMGIPALAVFLWFCVVFIVSGWRAYLKMSDHFWRPVTLAMLFCFIGVMLWSNTQPNFMLTEGTLFVGVMVGIVMACRELETQQRQAEGRVQVVTSRHLRGQPQ
jgi:O-antigen ligase